MKRVPVSLTHKYMTALTFLACYMYFNKNHNGVELVLWPQASLLSGIMWTCKCFIHM